jgi:hypothetical protein
MLAGEITSSRGSEHQAKQFVQNLPKPLDWVDRRTHSAGTTYLGQAVADPTGLWLLEFWNRSLKHVDSLDATTPGPGPSRTPDLASPNGTLRHDAGVPYVLADNGVRMIGQVVERHGDLLLTRLPSHPWRLAEAVYGRSPDGWIGTDATIAHFGPTNVPGILRVQVGRSGFCAAGAPTAVATVTVGTVALNEQREAVVGHRLARTRFIVHNCSSSTHAFHVTPPYAVQLHVSRLFVPRDYGLPDGRSLGAQVDLQFTKR